MDPTRALPTLLESLKEEDPDIRTRAICALDVQRDVPPDVIPVLTSALGDRSWAVRYWSAYLLGRAGAAARPAVPALRKALKDTDSDVRRAAAEAVRTIDR
jgi:HEAT repeat protein